MHITALYLYFLRPAMADMLDDVFVSIFLCLTSVTFVSIHLVVPFSGVSDGRF